MLTYIMKEKSVKVLVAQWCPDSVSPQTVAQQAPPSMGFSRQPYWSGLPEPSLLPQGVNPGLLPWGQILYHLSHRGSLCLLLATFPHLAPFQEAPARETAAVQSRPTGKSVLFVGDDATTLWRSLRLPGSHTSFVPVALSVPFIT